jgi:hypothetical protein
LQTGIKETLISWQLFIVTENKKKSPIEAQALGYGANKKGPWLKPWTLVVPIRILC